MNQDRNIRVLLIDQDSALGPVLRNVLGSGYSLSRVSSSADAVPLIEKGDVDVVLLNWDDHEPVKHLRDLLLASRDPLITAPVVAFSWNRAGALDALREGAFDFFLQPFSIPELRFALDRAYRRLALARELASAQRLIGTKCVKGLLGNSKGMEHVCQVIHKVAEVFTTVLITGESGTGKEVVARAIHDLSSRAEKPFVAFSACALPETLIEDELFGHAKGAFTGAAQARRGRFEEAQGGTIFLDEIGDLALPLQAKLLRVLQERTMERLGSNVPVPLDVRVICATNRDLGQMVREGTFRQDLFFRISVVKVQLPPLRERAEDIPLLAQHFLRAFQAAHGKTVKGLSGAFLTALAGHQWPGNVRELQNVMERAVVLADGQLLGVDDLPPEISRLAAELPKGGGTYHEAVKSFKRELVRSALRLHDGNKLKAAEELRISRCYLHRLLNQLNIGVEATISDAEEDAFLSAISADEAVAVGAPA